jgi:Asp-tRNA(Asn)/Glu-tRNA(Gln) amidotransferase A subunit family amidase
MAISMPAGFTAACLPVGLQLVGGSRADWDLLAVARAFEAATGHAAVIPDSAHALAGPERSGSPANSDGPPVG